MLTMRKGFSISFADELSEGYKTDGKIFTANVSAQKTLPLLEDFIKLHENERLFFILELRSVYKELHADHETGAADNK